MTTLLDDPSVLVRRALAEALCRASEAPRTLILALAADEPEVAAPVLQSSPVLTDADLVDCARTAGVVAQTALARRPNLPPGATAALAEIGERDAILALIGNAEIDLPAELLHRILRALQRRREPARRAARTPVTAGKLEGAHRRRGGEGLGRRGVAVDAARAGRAHRPRGARSGALHHRLVMPPRRAGGAHAHPARSRRADARVALAFAAWRRSGLCSRTLWRNCPPCRCRASPPSSWSRTGKASLRSRNGLA